MPFIRFTQDRKTVEAEPQVFAAGRVYELSAGSCERWKRRKVAEDATEADFKAQAKADNVAAKKAAEEEAAARKAVEEAAKKAAEEEAARKAAEEEAARKAAAAGQPNG